MPVIATWSPADAALGVLVPLGLACAATTGLVIDLDPRGPKVGSGPTLADLVSDGPTRAQLEPRSGAAAFLSNGGIDPDDAFDVVAAFADRWPAVVLRCSPRIDEPHEGVTFLPLLPEPYGLKANGNVVYQRCAFSPRDHPGAPTLPRLTARTVRRLLSGQTPRYRDPWIRALRDVWELA
ncbi:MAG: hypothetical protein ACR2N7_10780 [Acidimicrobiia bacterium]